MRKYDVTGVGLNLGTADEFVRKTGMALPHGWENSESGVWVLGLIKVRAERWLLCHGDGCCAGCRGPWCVPRPSPRLAGPFVACGRPGRLDGAAEKKHPAQP
jgi:hypothetical protein